MGTTALRLIESGRPRAAPCALARATPTSSSTPGFTFRVTDALMTNFHLPKSTLMMLVSALMGQDAIETIYAHAIASGYRFFSYGDASLLIPPERRKTC